MLMNYCPSALIRLCQLTEAGTCEGFREPTKGLIKHTHKLLFIYINDPFVWKLKFEVTIFINLLKK